MSGILNRQVTNLKNKIKRLSKGDFHIPQPEIIFPETRIIMRVGEGEMYKGSFSLQNQGEGTIRGLVYPSSFRVRCEEQGFDGNPVNISYTYDGSGLVPGHVEHGKFTIVCNGGEYEVVFTAIIEKPFVMTTYGKVQSLEDFKKLSFRDPAEAEKLFRSRDFYEILKYDRLEQVTDMPKIDTSEKELVLSDFDIELQNVSFAYDSRQIIKNISFKVPQGSICAIVGPSGSGKTTLCNLIARFWDVQDGKILIGGQNIKEYTADSLMRYISMVFQNVYLFNDTIENNIRFGNPDATHEQVVEAAKRAQCHDFISALPKGYDTTVGEGGSSLSGGEKQRISIARAILKDAPIVILDEATSSVDPENEHELLSAILELTHGKTLISIAHRLTTVQNADQILVIDNGTVVQQGTHSELLTQDGIYQSFWKQRKEATGWTLGG